MESLIQFIFKNNTLLIEVLFGVVLIGILYLAIRIFVGKDSMDNGSVDLSGIEESLKKIMDSRPHAKSEGGASVTITEVDGAALEELKSEISSLRETINRKELEIADLNTKIEAGGAVQAPTNPDTAKLEEQIRDLQGKLDEYSIIEDDIADLSFYKEETVRLQAELDRVKSESQSGKGSVATPPVAAATTAAPTPAAAPVVEEDILAVPPAAEAVTSFNEVAAPAVPQASTPAAENESGEVVDNEFMAQFKAIVEEQKAGTLVDKKPAAPKGEAPASTPAVPLDPFEAALAAAGMAETPAPVAAPAQTPVPNPPAPASEAVAPPAIDFDMDKMLDEASGLVNAAVSEEEAPNVLEQNLDTDKLLDEANLMGGEDSKLLSDFDSFMKKEGSN